jgi:hypothetical protein
LKRTSNTKKESYPCSRPRMPIRLWDVEVPTFSKQSTQRWGCQTYVPVALYYRVRFMVLNPDRGWVNPKAIVLLEGWGKLKKKKKNSISSGSESATFRLVAKRHEDVWGSGCIDPCFLDLGTRWWWVVSSMPRSLYLWGKDVGWDPDSVWMRWRSDNSLLHWDSNSDCRPALSQSLCWLRWICLRLQVRGGKYLLCLVP